MSWQMAALLLLGGSTVLLFIGMPVAFSFIAINLIGAMLFLGGEPGLLQLVRNSAAAVTNFSLTPIPLFILMGEVLFHTGLAVKVIDGVERLIRQVPGRLAVVAVVAGTVGTIIEAYDFLLYVIVAPLVFANLYFPSSEPLAGTLQAFGIYAVGFVARPVGRWYGDCGATFATLTSSSKLGEDIRWSKNACRT